MVLVVAHRVLAAFAPFSRRAAELSPYVRGGQLQPFFAKSDQKFSSREVLLSGAVASDRSANERAVNRMKASGMIARGIHQCQDLSQAAYLWEAWGFQYNFMCNPVL
jgi:hypothetical protein